MSNRDAEATRARILRAAMAEFAAVGLAGGRVERIAAQSESNVRMIYAYFGNKAGLFDAAVHAAVEGMAAAVPPTPGMLAEWAGRLFDYHRADPTALRVSLWAQLERPEVAAEPMEAYMAKTLTVSSETGGARRAIDLLAIVYAIAQAGTVTPRGLLSADGADPDDPERVAQHRAAVVAAVAAIVEPRAS
ncbi:AcrR family transcriptional regulator [Microbacterium terrae]|uniref:HTH-type transcriptional repressor NicS n=1 Tax=Microbacterium terrae TaxID=69369 RepID=A0A0M2HHY1_9MICO|nr:TetR family transcriptional regulator [Microbacterium terrae]KJL43905.1 HTH-type transcriptional repressor NicS [Microbacterium terrae]MBP1078686.1 AcrR family transcriptional regulator [Microbacterium terrae]GLJ98087.1 putative TetR family regulatory protein [Microbacterium terrae]